MKTVRYIKVNQLLDLIDINIKSILTLGKVDRKAQSYAKRISEEAAGIKMSQEEYDLFKGGYRLIIGLDLLFNDSGDTTLSYSGRTRRLALYQDKLLEDYIVEDAIDNVIRNLQVRNSTVPDLSCVYSYVQSHMPNIVFRLGLSAGIARLYSLYEPERIEGTVYEVFKDCNSYNVFNN